MSRLSEIPVRIEPQPVGGLGGGVAALLMELAGSLQRLAVDGEATSIDLRSLPLSDAERAELQATLGHGEVQAVIEAAGHSLIRETRYAGLWWVEHHDADGRISAEMLEVTRIPAILLSATDEILAAAGELRGRVAGGPGP
jgi:hydrogenase-1 operon protein HyaF